MKHGAVKEDYKFGDEAAGMELDDAGAGLLAGDDDDHDR